MSNFGELLFFLNISLEIINFIKNDISFARTYMTELFLFLNLYLRLIKLLLNNKNAYAINFFLMRLSYIRVK